MTINNENRFSFAFCKSKKIFISRQEFFLAISLQLKIRWHFEKIVLNTTTLTTNDNSSVLNNFVSYLHNIMKTFSSKTKTSSSKCSWDFGNVVGEQNTFVFKTHFLSILAGEQPHFFFVKNTELFSNHTLFELKNSKKFRQNCRTGQSCSSWTWKLSQTESEALSPRQQRIALSSKERSPLLLLSFW